jgi:hypothetical protein
MRFVFSDRESSKDRESGFRFTKSYVEIEIPISDDSAKIVYVLARSEDSGFVATCWGGWLFDFLIPDRKTVSLDRLAPSCVLAALVKSGASGEFKDGGIVHLLDPDDSQRKWCLAYLVNGIDFSDERSVLGHDVLRAVEEVAQRSNELWRELKSNNRDVWGLGCTAMDVEQIDKRLHELDEAEEYTAYTLKKLDRPSGLTEHVWWGMTWLSGTRGAWWSGTARALRKIRNERVRLRVARLKRTLNA